MGDNTTRHGRRRQPFGANTDYRASKCAARPFLFAGGVERAASLKGYGTARYSSGVIVSRVAKARGSGACSRTRRARRPHRGASWSPAEAFWRLDMCVHHRRVESVTRYPHEILFKLAVATPVRWWLLAQAVLAIAVNSLLSTVWRPSVSGWPREGSVANVCPPRTSAGGVAEKSPARAGSAVAWLTASMRAPDDVWCGPVHRAGEPGGEVEDRADLAGADVERRARARPGSCPPGPPAPPR